MILTKQKANRKKKKNQWKPKYCISCGNLIKPGEKSASYQAASMTVYYFHESCYVELLGPTVGGRVDTSKVHTKVREAETKRREQEEKQIWNTFKKGSKKWNHLGDIKCKPPVSYPNIHAKILAKPIFEVGGSIKDSEVINGVRVIKNLELYEFSITDKQFRDEYMSNPEQRLCERCGLGMDRLTKDSPVWICPNKHTETIIKHPKAHVEDFEPSQDTKDDDLNTIIAEIRERGPLTSLQLEEFTGVKRSTITWRLWDNTIGNTKSKKNQELFYFIKGPKGVQFYGLVNERIKKEEKE